jgi:hypothetical protein
MYDVRAVQQVMRKESQQAMECEDFLVPEPDHEYDDDHLWQ